MRIDVTQDHINRGVPKQCDKCPVTLAISEATGKSYNTSIDFIYSHHGEIIVPLPLEVSAWIRNFDRYSPDAGYEPKPFSFEIDLP